MSLGKISTAIAACTLSLCTVGTPLASEFKTEVNVQMNMARILRLPSDASTVVVGNPLVADATIQDPKTIVLTGNSFGSTNLIALDAVGNPIADLLVHVSAEQDNMVIVYQGMAKTSVACAPTCQPMALGGDDPVYTKNVVESLNSVASIGQEN
jgi:Flp pilus assembly secretin CpaC